MKYIYKHSLFWPIVVFTTLFIAFVIFHPYFTKASSLPVADVVGYATSDMSHPIDQVINPGNLLGGSGFGWISMSSASDGSPQEYGVTFDPNTGNFGGQAWSEYGGWVDMAPLSGYPFGGNPWGAKVNTACLQTPGPCLVTGWIKFLAGGTSQSGGWDGWVSMHEATGNTNLYGVLLDPVSGFMSGTAWGGDVVGWVRFENVQVLFSTLDSCPNVPGDQDIAWMNQNSYVFDTQWNPQVCVYDDCYLDTNADGYWDFFDGNNPQCVQGGQVDISATACNAGSSTITWNSWDPHNAVSCTASGGFGFSGTVSPTGSLTVNNLPDGQTTFTLGPCTDSLGNTVYNYPVTSSTTDTAIVQCGAVTPTTPLGVTLSDNDSCKPNDSEVYWIITNGTPGTICTTSVNGNGSGFSVPSPGTPASGTDSVSVDLNGITTFTLSCHDPVNGTAPDVYTQFSCGTPPPQEICNGTDDDGDLQIDEGCPGVPTGGINPIIKET